MKKWLDKYQSKGEVNSLLTNKPATSSSDNTSVFVRQAPKKVDVIPVSSPEVQKALINYKPKPAPVYTVSKWKGGKTKDKYYDPYERIIENDPESEVNVTNRMRKNFIMNKLPAALGTAIGLELIPTVSSAMNIPIAGVTGLTGHNIVNAGFATHGLKSIMDGDVTEYWKQARKSGKPIDYAKAVAENAMTAMELVPLVAPTYKGAIEAGNYLTTQTPLKNAYKLNPYAKSAKELFTKGSLKNNIPGANPEFIQRGVADEAAIDDLLNTGIVRNRLSAGLPSKGRWKENVYWGVEGDPFASNKYNIIAKNSKGLKNRPVVYSDIKDIQIRGENGEYSSLPNWQEQINKPNWLKGYKEISKPKIFTEGQYYEQSPHIYRDMFPINGRYEPRTVITDGAVKNEMVGLEPTPIVYINNPTYPKTHIPTFSAAPTSNNFKLRIERDIPIGDQIINNAFNRQHMNYENIILEGDELKHYLSLDEEAQKEFIKNYKLKKDGGVIMHVGGQSTLNPVVKKDNRNWLEYLKN